jgi:hypothetical protein
VRNHEGMLFIGLRLEVFIEVKLCIMMLCRSYLYFEHKRQQVFQNVENAYQIIWCHGSEDHGNVY